MGVLFDIITVGSSTIDVFVKTDIHSSTLRGRSGERLGKVLAYPLGAKILISHIDFQVGGAGTNTAVAFSRLGLKTGYVGKLGHDDSGVKIYRALKEERVRFIGALGKTSGYSVVLDSKDADRTILTHKGDNDLLKMREINKDLLNAKWFYFGSMMGESLATLKKLSVLAEKRGICVAFNPSNYLAMQGVNKLRRILDATDVLILNKEEAQSLCGKHAGNIADMLAYMRLRVKMCAVVTDGKNGVWCFDGKKIYHSMPRPKLRVVETTGAGDAFGSGFVTGLLWSKSIEDSIRIGLIQAEAVIQSYGAKTGLLEKHAMEKRLAADRRKVAASEVFAK